MVRASRQARPIGATALALALAVLFLAGGCGSSGSGSEDESSSTAATEHARTPPGASAKSCATDVRGVGALRASGTSCATAAQVVAAWVASPGCAPSGASTRISCRLGHYRCLGVVVDRGLGVSCARLGRSVSFVAARSYNGSHPPT